MELCLIQMVCVFIEWFLNGIFTDVDEMLCALSELPTGMLYRPPRLRKIFASKACRKSVMIGRALRIGEMQTVGD
jgi:DNA mismatch repair ATPase MutL